VHNSGWVQGPSRDVLRNRAKHAALQAYVKGVIGRFKDDKRVQVWDIYNERTTRTSTRTANNRRRRPKCPTSRSWHSP
jgi:GH35 family endo-1,4-beta-xylanase